MSGNEQHPLDAEKKPQAKEGTKKKGWQRPGETAEEDKVPIHEKALYGLGSPSLGLVDQIIQYQVQQVLVYGMGMSPVWKGIIIMIYRIWDSLTDPVMGWISDNSRTRFGRRRPFMFLGCILMACLMPFVWRFDENWDMLWIAIWFTFFGILVSTATTVYNIPYQSLKMEMTPDYNERTSVNVYAGIIVTCFSFLNPWVWKLTQQPFFTGQAPGEEPNTLYGIRNVAIFFAILVLIIGLIPTFVCKERYYVKAQKQKKEPLLKSLKLTFRSKPFLLMLIIILTMNLEGLVMGMGGYITLYHVFDGDKIFAATYTGVSGTMGAVLGLFSIPLFGALARRFGKERSLLLVTLGHILMALSILWFYNPEFLKGLAKFLEGILQPIYSVFGAEAMLDYRWLAMIPGVFNGLLMSGLWTVVPAMKADIVDDDEARTGERREGSFESIFSWFQKFTGTVFHGLSGFIVVMAGFDIKLEVNQAEGVFTRMILMMSLIPVGLGIVQLWIILNWPLTPGRMAEIRDYLEKVRGKINEPKAKQ